MNIYKILNVLSSIEKCTDSVDIIINASSDDRILYNGSHDSVQLAVSPDSGAHDYVYCPGNLREFSATKNSNSRWLEKKFSIFGMEFKQNFKKRKRKYRKKE